jgi:hypothetical protein
MYIIFVDTGKPLSKRQANGVYATIGVHLVRGWMLLHAIGNSKLFAQVGEFLQKYHERDLDEALQEMSRCANIRIPNFLTACVARITLWGITRLGQCDRTGDLQGAGVCH